MPTVIIEDLRKLYLPGATPAFLFGGDFSLLVRRIGKTRVFGIP